MIKKIITPEEKCCCDYKVKGVCRYQGRHTICEEGECTCNLEHEGICLFCNKPKEQPEQDLSPKPNKSDKDVRAEQGEWEGAITEVVTSAIGHGFYDAKDGREEPDENCKQITKEYIDRVMVLISQELAKQEAYKGKQKREWYQRGYTEGFSLGSDTMYHETRKELPKSYQKGIKEERARISELTGKINIIEPPEDVEKLPDKRSAFMVGQVNLHLRLFDILEALKD